MFAFDGPIYLGYSRGEGIVQEVWRGGGVGKGGRRDCAILVGDIKVMMELKAEGTDDAKKVMHGVL